MIFGIGVIIFYILNERNEQDAACEPKCGYVERFCETNYLNNFVHFFPVTAVWNVEWGGVQSAECEESGVLSGECRVWSGDCGKVWGIKCGM